MRVELYLIAYFLGNLSKIFTYFHQKTSISINFCASLKKNLKNFIFHPYFLDLCNIRANSPEQGSEEWVIHDYEYFGSIQLEEHEDISIVVKMAEIIEKHGELGAETIAYHNNLDEAESALNEYCGEYDSEKDYAIQFMNNCYEISEFLEIYIDYSKIASDLFICDYYSIEIHGKCHVFRNV